MLAMALFDDLSDSEDVAFAPRRARPAIVNLAALQIAALTHDCATTGRILEAVRC